MTAMKGCPVNALFQPVIQLGRALADKNYQSR